MSAHRNREQIVIIGLTTVVRQLNTTPTSEQLALESWGNIYRHKGNISTTHFGMLLQVVFSLNLLYNNLPRIYVVKLYYDHIILQISVLNWNFHFSPRWFCDPEAWPKNLQGQLPTVIYPNSLTFSTSPEVNTCISKKLRITSGCSKIICTLLERLRVSWNKQIIIGIVFHNNFMNKFHCKKCCLGWKRLKIYSSMWMFHPSQYISTEPIPFPSLAQISLAENNTSMCNDNWSCTLPDEMVSLTNFRPKPLFIV